ncbi:MAG: DUF4149 domain-containing protein [Deltaproteobacteria bacterium]|nr:DUF4149 domain-containing protein [Deltaproteobacteria bacterium]
MVTPPGHETFTEADLAPPEWEAQARRRARVDRGATFVAVLGLGLWCGGLVALGACAAPMVFGLTPYPFSADAMSAAFARFDGIAIGCVVAALGAEATRTFLDLRSPRAPRDRRLARARRYLGMLAAAGAIVSGTMLTPEIVRLHKSGVRRGVGPEGAHLAAVHKQAESLSKGLLVAAVATLALHIATIRSARDDEDDDAAAPLPPGPRQ